MDERTEKSALERFAAILIEHAVEFIVIGGQAELLHGSSRATFDVDICYRRSPDNLERLASALIDLNPRLRDAPPDLPFRIDAESLGLGANFAFTTDIGDIDLMGYVEPLGGYDELLDRAERYRIDSIELDVISVDDLITIKQYLGRPKDQQSLVQLLAIKRIRQE